MRVVLLSVLLPLGSADQTSALGKHGQWSQNDAERAPSQAEPARRHASEGTPREPPAAHAHASAEGSSKPAPSFEREKTSASDADGGVPDVPLVRPRTWRTLGCMFVLWLALAIGSALTDADVD
jgi:hypothetical protein